MFVFAENAAVFVAGLPTRDPRVKLWSALLFDVACVKVKVDRELYFGI